MRNANLLLLMCFAALGIVPRSLGVPSTFKDSAALVETYTGDIIGTNQSVGAICEDPGGTLYAGADRLIIYDGSTWSQAELQNTSLIKSMAYLNGRVWIGGVREVGYYTRGADGKYTYTSATSQLNTELEGMVWYTFAVDDSIVFITDRKVIMVPAKGGPAHVWELPNDRRLTAQRLSAGVLVCQPSSEGTKLWMFRNKTLEPVESVPQPMSVRAFDFVAEKDGHWIFDAGHSGEGHDIYDYDLKTREVRTLYPDKDTSLRKSIIAYGASLNGYVYLATINSGLLILSAEGDLIQGSRTPGLSSRCESVCVSSAGGVWVGHDKGVSFVHDISLARLVFPGVNVRLVAATKEQLAVATSQEVWRLTDDGLKQFPLQIASLMAIDSNVYASAFRSLYVKDAASPDFRKISINAPVSGSLHKMTVSRKTPDVLYMLHSRGIVSLNLSTEKTAALDVPDVPTNLVEDADGVLWLSTFTGGIRVVDSDLQKVTIKVADRELSSVLLHEGRPLSFVRKKGIFEIDGRSVQGTLSLTEEEGTKNAEGPAWIVGSAGDAARVGRIESSSGQLRWTRKNLPGLKGARGLRPISQVEDHLFVALDTGVIDATTSDLQNADLTVPAVEELKIRDLRQHRVRTASFVSGPGRGLELSDVEGEFSLTLKKRLWGLLEKPSYESRLLPLEDDWTPHTYGDPITRKNLPAGHYTLQLRARHLGEVGEPASFTFTRLPPWYASQLGITVMALGAVFLFFGAVKFRTRQIEQKNRHLEEKIRERTHELAKANAAKSEFLAAMSHEIRNPMNGVVGIVKMLQESNLGVREKYLLSTLHRCSEQLRTTVDDVLDFSKIEAGEITLNVDTFDLAETIRSTIAAIDVTGERAELSSWAGSHPVVKGDQAKLAQILTNYLSNALKYGVPGRATVDVFVLDEGDKRCRVTIAVKNYGPDIPPAEVSKLFERFQRGEFAKVRRIGGNGLGLSICKRYAEVMGGSVGVTSSGGVTVFQVSLPLEKTELRRTSGDILQPNKLNARALAIEDEDYNRLVLGNVLHKLGYKVDWAGDGKSAITLAEQNGYDLILTDWMLPDIDGGALTQKLLQICEDPKPPIFAVTAYSTKEKYEECLAAGMAGFISKPVTLEKLEAALQGWGANHVSRPMYEGEEPVTPVSIQQLSKLGPIGVMVPEFTRRLEHDWQTVEHLLATDLTQAANAAHKMISATLLVEAQYISDQLRILEEQIRKGAPTPDLEKLRDICREEIEKVAKSLRAAAKRHQRLNDDANNLNGVAT